MPEKSYLMAKSFDDPAFADEIKDLTLESFIGMIKDHVHKVIHDPLISRSRRVLVIEQFANEQLRDLYNLQSHDYVISFFKGGVQFFINKRVLKAFDVDVMAAQLAFPISNLICAIDINHEIEGETLELIERHIRQFFKVYSS